MEPQMQFEILRPKNNTYVNQVQKNLFEENPFLLVGVAVATTVAIPAVIALAPVAIASLGVAVGVLALTAVGAGVIATTAVIGNHIDEAIEAHDSHNKISKILDNTGTDDEKIEKIARNKKNNLFLKLQRDEASEAVSELYLGALDYEREKGEARDTTKILKGLRLVNELDGLSKTEPARFLSELKEFKEKNNNLTTQQVGKKITEHSDHLYSLLNDETKGLFHYFSALKEQIKAAAAASTDAPVPAAGAGDLDRGGAGGTGTGVAAGPDGRTGSNAALAAADAAAREIKISGDFFTDDLSPEKLSSVMYKYKLIMGLNILESTKSEDDKIKELKKLMQIRLDVQSNGSF